MEVGDQGHSQTEHESAVQRDLGEAQQADDEQGQQAVEPDHLGPFHEFCIFRGQVIVVGLFIVFVMQLGSFASGNQAGATAFFQQAHITGEDQQDDQTHTLQRQQLLPQFVYVRIQHHAGTGHRAAPGQQVHDGHGSTDDADQDNRTHMQLLVDRQHSGDGDQQGGSQSAIQVGDNGDAGRCDGNHHDVGTGFFHQPVYHGVEQAHITHHGEVYNGEDEQYSRGPGLGDTGLHEIKDLDGSEPADQRRDHRYHDEQRYRVGFPTDQGGYDDDNHQETNYAQKHNAISSLKIVMRPGRAVREPRYKYGMIIVPHPKSENE